jgi:hypothetical protein
MITILCQWDFNEQIEKLVRLLYSISVRTVQENSTPEYILYPVSKRVIKKHIYNTKLNTYRFPKANLKFKIIHYFLILWIPIICTQIIHKY